MSRRWTSAALAIGCSLLVVAGVLSTGHRAGADSVSCATGWSADYYLNENLAGAPVISRCDAAIDFDWTGTSPGPAIARTWGYSTRWTSNQTMAAGSYRFTATADDGVRVYLDGTLVINEWQDENVTDYNTMVTVAAGVHTIVVEYFQDGGDAIAKFSITNVIDDSPTLNTLTSTEDFTGTALDPTSWDVYNSAGTATPDANDPTKVSVSDGMLELQTQGLAGSGVCMCTPNSEPTTPYGRWDVRARMSAGSANGGVILLWPNAENWPVGGEIDLAEINSAARTSSDFVVHYGAQNNQMLLTTPLDATAWHVYSVEWTPTEIRFWIDGLLLKTITDPAMIPTGAMHLVAQVGPHTDATADTTESELDIDWIKRYSYTASGANTTVPSSVPPFYLIPPASSGS